MNVRFELDPLKLLREFEVSSRARHNIRMVEEESGQKLVPGTLYVAINMSN